MYSDNDYSEGIPRSALHLGFAFIYLLLFGRILFDIIHQVDDKWTVAFKLSERLSRSFYEPFLGSFVWVEPQAALYAIFCFGFLHCAIINASDEDMDNPMLSKVINFFRLTFFITATLLALLIVVRLAVDTYRDLFVGRPQIFVGAPVERRTNQNSPR